MFKDLLFYDAPSGYTEFYSTSHGTISQLVSGPTLGPGWTHIVQSFASGLLCYNASTGDVQVWHIRLGYTGASVLMNIPGWRRGWTQIVAGDFVRGASNDFLFYDAAMGLGEFYTFDGAQLRLVSRHPNWRRSWRHIVAGNFGGNRYTDLLFYDAAAGLGEFYAVDGGQIFFLRGHDYFRTSWNQIVSFDSAYNESVGHLLLYDAAARTGETFAVSQGQLTQLKSHNWRRSWTRIVPGYFGGEVDVVLLFYDAAAGIGTFYTVSNGVLRLLRTHTDWRNSWDLIVPGYYEYKAVPL